MAVPPAFGEIFLSAARKGNLTQLQSLSLRFENGEGPGKVLYAELKTPKGENALLLAARYGTPEACTFLIEVLGFNINGTSGELEETPLFGALFLRNWPTAIRLINSGAEVTKCTTLGDTPMHCVADSGSMKIAKLLISKGADVNVMSQRGTPLGFAARTGHPDFLKFLLELHADPNPNSLLVDMPPLISAMHAEPKPNIECMELLLKGGADPNRQSYGRTPLFLASCNLVEDTVRCLLRGGADPNATDFVGYTPLDHAAMRGRNKMVEVLFPVTSRIAFYPDWSIRGVMQHAKSVEAMALYMTRQKKLAAFAKRKAEEAFRRKSYFDAFNWYSEAAGAAPFDAKVLSNRSLCSVKTNNGMEALKDAQACIKLEPSWGKAHYREGVAWTLLKDFKKAAKSFSRALALDPGNEEFKQAHRAAQAELK